MLYQIPPNQDRRRLVEASAMLSADQSLCLGEFLQGKCRPLDWTNELWTYLCSGEASEVELEHILDLRMAFGEPFLKAIRMSNQELVEGITAWITLDAMTDLARALFSR